MSCLGKNLPIFLPALLPGQASCRARGWALAPCERRIAPRRADKYLTTPADKGQKL